MTIRIARAEGDGVELAECASSRERTFVSSEYVLRKAGSFRNEVQKSVSVRARIEAPELKDSDIWKNGKEKSS